MHGTLIDDESVRKKAEVMYKWDAMMDDSRNVSIPADLCEQIDEFLEFGKSYKIVIGIEEIK